METFIRVVQLLLSLSILVLLHEFGHYITARMFKTRVEKFYLFFDFLFPFPNVLNFALFKKKIGETEYGLGWFPLGGYVKIAGMIDESMDEEFLKSEPKPWEFRSKKPWQRLIIMLGGIMMNVVLAYVIYSQMLYWWGEKKMPIESAVYGFEFDSLAHKIGFIDGDKVVSFNGGRKFSGAGFIAPDLLVNNAKTVEVERLGKLQTIQIPVSVYKEMLATELKGEFAEPSVPCIVDTLIPEMPLTKAGGMLGDTIIGLDSLPIHTFMGFHNHIVNLKSKPVDILVHRGKDTLHLNVTVSDSGLVGFSTYSQKHFKFITTQYGFFASFLAGFTKTYEKIGSYIKQVKIIFNPELKGYKQVGSFLSISQQFSVKWDWERFWTLTAFLSIALAFANLLPIPALDGGHALFTLYEMVTGKAPGEKFMERAQVVGMIIIFGLMIFAFSNDIMRVFFHSH